MQGGVVAAGSAGVEGERANARSVTPHCAHLPTRPTPKFELGSQPRRFSSTRLPSSPSDSPRYPAPHPRVDPLHGKRTGRDVSPLTPSAYTTSICDPLRSLLLAGRAISRGEPKVVRMCVYGRALCGCIRVSSSCGNRYQRHRLALARAPYPLDNTPRRGPACSFQSGARPKGSIPLVAESVPRRDPIDPVASPLGNTSRLLPGVLASVNLPVALNDFMKLTARRALSSLRQCRTLACRMYRELSLAELINARNPEVQEETNDRTDDVSVKRILFVRSRRIVASHTRLLQKRKNVPRGNERSYRRRETRTRGHVVAEHRRVKSKVSDVARGSASDLIGYPPVRWLRLDGERQEFTCAAREERCYSEPRSLNGKCSWLGAC